MLPFRNRSEAGRFLAKQLESANLGPEALVLVLPRGGAPVGFEIARALHAEMDVFLVRKLGVPDQEELAFGAIASGGVRVLNRELIERLRLSPEVIAQVNAREQRVLESRERLYRENRPAISIRGRTVVLVDDGLATGASMLAAARALRPGGVRAVTIAVPVAPSQSCEELRREADQVLCAATPEPFGAVGFWYEDFAQVTDEQVRKLLEQAAAEYGKREQHS